MSNETVTAAPLPGRLAPDPEVLAVIVAAVQVHLDTARVRAPRPAAVGAPWRFSGRSWAVVAASRRDRPLRARW